MLVLQFRLKQSGIGCVYYLVEEYDKNTVHESMEKGVFTALSSTQIVDGIFLKETRDIEDTIEWVAGLHATIVAQYQVCFSPLLIALTRDQMLISLCTLRGKTSTLSQMTRSTGTHTSPWSNSSNRHIPPRHITHPSLPSAT